MAEVFGVYDNHGVCLTVIFNEFSLMDKNILRDLLHHYNYLISKLANNLKIKKIFLINILICALCFVIINYSLGIYLVPKFIHVFT